MSRSGYHDDLDHWDLIRWRGAVASAIRGQRGQAFLREMLAALDALPEKRLIAGAWVVPDGPGIHPDEQGCCAMGAVALRRGLDLSDVEPYDDYDRDQVAKLLGIADALAAEIAHLNDERGRPRETPAERWTRMRQWVVVKIQELQS